MGHCAQRQRHAALFLLSQDLAVQLDDDEHGHDKRHHRHLLQQRMPRKRRHCVACQQEQPRRSHGTTDKRNQCKRRAEVEQDDDGNDHRLRPHHRPGVLEIEEDERERQPGRDGKQGIGRQPLVLRQPVGKQQRDEQQRADGAQPDVLIRLRKNDRPDHEVQRVAEHPQRTHEADAAQPRRALFVKQCRARQRGSEVLPDAGRPATRIVCGDSTHCVRHAFAKHALS